MQTQRLNKTASDVLSAILCSDRFLEYWNAHYPAEKNSGALKGMALRISDAQDDFSQDPDLLAFMISMVDLERGALYSAVDFRKLSDDEQRLRDGLDGLSGYLSQIVPDLDQKALGKSFTKSQVKVIKMLRRETAQIKYQPFSDVAHFAGHIAGGIKETAVEHPVSGAALLTGLAGMGWFMVRMGGTNATLSYDPTLVGMGPEAFMPGAPPPEEFQTYLTQQQINDIIPSCHDHLLQLAGGNQVVADFMVDPMHLDMILGQHCVKLDTYASGVRGAYDWYNTRFEYLLDVAPDGLVSILPHPESPLVQAFVGSTSTAKDWTIAFNTVENLAVHLFIIGTSVIYSAKAVNFKNDEASEIYTESRNFLQRSVMNTPMTYGAAAAMLAYTASQSDHIWSVSQGFHPVVTWGTIGGLALGQGLHKAHKYFNRRAHVTDMMQGASLSAFNQYSAAQPAAQKPAKPDQKKSLVQHFKIPAIGAVVGGALSAVDMHYTGGHVTGSVLGTASVVGPYLVINGPEDAGFHVGFGAVGSAAGASVGGTYLLGKFGLKKAWNGIKHVLPSAAVNDPVPAPVSQKSRPNSGGPDARL